MPRFTDRTVLITGAASGIGAAAARRFAEEGANLVLSDLDEPGLDAIADDLPQGRVRVVTGDAADQATAQAMVDKAQDAFGGIDIVIPNAGIAVTGKLSEITVEEFRKQMTNNVDGVFLAMKCAWPALQKSGGCVVVTSSVSGMRGDFGGLAYNASKGAISNIVRAAALDYGAHGIRVNAVAPGFTKTGLTEDDLGDADFMQAMTARIPMGRGAEPEEIASVMAFLASEDASFVNGVILPVDGGVTASNGQPPLG